jgi:hypothetical protein
MYYSKKEKEKKKERSKRCAATLLFPSLSALTCQKKHDSSHTLPPLIQPLPCRQSATLPCRGKVTLFPSCAMHDGTRQWGLSLRLPIKTRGGKTSKEEKREDENRIEKGAGIV